MQVRPRHEAVLSKEAQEDPSEYDRPSRLQIAAISSLEKQEV